MSKNFEKIGGMERMSKRGLYKSGSKNLCYANDRVIIMSEKSLKDDSSAFLNKIVLCALRYIFLITNKGKIRKAIGGV